MDLSDAIKREVFRPLATVLIPGGLALAPYVIVAQHYIPHVLAFWHEHDAAFSALVIACMLAVGLLLEDVGALLENRVLDLILERLYPGHHSQRHRYLSAEDGR